MKSHHHQLEEHQLKEMKTHHHQLWENEESSSIERKWRVIIIN